MIDAPNRGLSPITTRTRGACPSHATWRILGTLARPLAAILHPRCSQCMQDQLIRERQRFGFDYGAIGVVDDRIASDAPVLVPDNSATMFTRGFRSVPIAVIPTSRNIRCHWRTSINFHKFRAALASSAELFLKWRLSAARRDHYFARHVSM